MGELYDMNLKGRPLAYTPFCDNNKEMDGYRFWKQVSYQIVVGYIINVFWSSCLLTPFCFPSVKGFLERSSARKTIPHQVGVIFASGMPIHSFWFCVVIVMIWCYSSALYVVDLAKFRQTASGDTLRVFYETLSKDPNSLSNLDQVIDHR